MKELVYIKVPKYKKNYFVGCATRRRGDIKIMLRWLVPVKKILM